MHLFMQTQYARMNASLYLSDIKMKCSWFVLVNENISNNTTREQMERKDPSAVFFCVCYISYEMSGIQGHRIQQSNCSATVLKNR